MKYFGNISKLKTKSNNIDLVTKADIESEKYIIKEIKDKYPKHSILAEESGVNSNNKEYLWVIDPLDGTTNFSHNLPIFAVSIALQKNNKTICGVVYNPAADKCFYAEQSKGSFLNKKRLKVSSCKTLSEALIATGFPYLHDDKYDKSFLIFKEFYDSGHGLRRLGAASLDLCFVAMGRLDGYYEYELKKWDICAGAIIALEANAKVTDWDNNKFPDNGKRIVASNKKIHDEMISILNNKKYRKYFFN